MMPLSKITPSHRTLLRVLCNNTKDKWSLMYRTKCNKRGTLPRLLAMLEYHS